MRPSNIKKEELTESALFDTVVLYQLLKKLTTPFNQTMAYKLGIIDSRGKVLRKRSTLKTAEEKNSFTVFDLFIFNIKKLIESIPGGKSILASYAAALYLMKEQNNDFIHEKFINFLEDGMNGKRTFKQLGELLEEKKEFSKEEAKKIGDKCGVNWSKVDLEQFRMGLGVETEHDKKPYDVVKNDSDLAKIALAHLDELPDYYTRLKKMEDSSKNVDEDGAGGGGSGAGGVPANTSGGGGIAGLRPGEVVINPKRKKFVNFLRRK